jgi:hypothetical protein
MCEKWGENYTPHIKVSFYSKNNVDYLEVYDNGIGMNQHIIDNYYANIGSSFYKSREFYELMAEISAIYKPISRFGIGILACFMVSDSLEVNTRRVIGRYRYDEPLKVSVEGYDSIFCITESDREEPGTTTTLQLRKVNPWNRMTDSSFINSVRSNFPYPPFDIEIGTTNSNETHQKDNFLNTDPSKLKNYYWQEDDNIQEIKINISNPEYGFTGSAIVGIIVKNGKPVDKIEVLAKEVTVDNENYTISMSIYYGDNNTISKSSINIGVSDSGDIESKTSQWDVVKSRAAFSIHGIELPNSLFPEYYSFTNKTTLRWPFPVLLVLDLGGNNDLNLNSARTEILYDSKWIEFEANLFFVICEQISMKIGKKKWNILKEIFIKKLEGVGSLNNAVLASNPLSPTDTILLETINKL